ncbi:MAG: nuclear transport factor 2 family protein [Gammaproteobacteria bacterium]|nr:nuclear transport factor 2 family protein [Gammaproteobacteria bacterium]
MKNQRTDEFLRIIESIPSSEVVTNPKEKFLSLFGDFKRSTTEDVIRSLYAEEFYFNDTFKTFRNRDELSEYLQETANNVDLTTVDILDVSKSETDYYLRWVMHMKFTAKGKEVDSRSIGMTQIRFNDEGKVILHQDYWDGAEGFYQHLPIVGYIVTKIKSSL